ncbi:MAG: hypothetical protein V7L00_19925 [Nostoc sp.]
MKIKGNSKLIFSDASGNYEMVLEDVNLFLQGSLTLEIAHEGISVDKWS